MHRSQVSMADFSGGLGRSLVGLALVLAACAQLPAPPAGSSADQAASCERFYAAVDTAVQRAGVADGAAARIEGFAYLRVDRLLASFAQETVAADRFNAWVERMRALDREGRAAEIANLPAAERGRLRASVPDGTLDAELERCADVLRTRDLAVAEVRDALRNQARVPDDYDDWKRVVGLYWIARIPFASGVRKYQARTQAVFDAPLAELPVRGQLVAYGARDSQSVSAQEIEAILRRAQRDALGIAAPTGADATRLLDAFAPVWLVEERDENDRIGRLVLGEDGRARVETSSPTVYRRLAHTRYRDQVLLQLVYSVWLPARPKTSWADLLGGHLDAVVWRVTLGPDGTPLVFDSIHSCGCYHQFFPTLRARPLPRQRTLDEQAFMPQRLYLIAPGSRIALRLEAGTHYIQRVLVDGVEPDVGLAAEADDRLRSLAAPAGGRRSAFRPDGIVPGSQRGERYLFWPMGVREPGAMRQWGRHATAFVGRRHFDEARAIERYFDLSLD